MTETLVWGQECAAYACHLGNLEDYMGAHEAKQKILEQEQMLQAHMDIFG